MSGAATPEEALDLAELGRAIGDYLRTLPLPARRAFLCRYYYADSLAETAPGLRHQRTGGQESAVPHPPGSADVSGKGGL